MRRNSPKPPVLALVVLLVTAPVDVLGEGTRLDLISLEQICRISNLVVSYSTPRERNILSHYSDPGELPASYQTARLVRIHACMLRLMESSTSIETLQYAAGVLLPLPPPELVAIKSVGEDSNGVGVVLTIHQLDVRTKLQLIAAFDEAVEEGNEYPGTTEWQQLVEHNPWRREMHLLQQEKGTRRLTEGKVALLRAR